MNDILIPINFLLYGLIQVIFVILLSPNIFLYLMVTIIALVSCFVSFNFAVIFHLMALSIISIFYSLNKEEDVFSPVRVFTAIWFIAIGISNLRISIYETPWSSYLWFNVLISILAFYLGAFIVRSMNGHGFVALNEIKARIKYTWSAIKSKMLLFIIFIISIVTIICEFNYAGAIPLFAGAFGIYVDSARAAMAINSYVHRIALSLVNVFTLSCFYIMLRNKDRASKNVLPFFTAMASLGLILLTASRLFLGTMIVPMVIGYNYLVKRIHKRTLVILAVAIFLLLVVSVAVVRNILPFDYLQEIGFSPNVAWLAPGYLSISMNFWVFDRVLEEMGSSFPFGFGWNSLYPLRVLFGSKDRGMEGLTAGLVPGAEWVTGTYLNEFYMDFGLIGVVLFPFLIGLISSLIYMRMRHKPSALNIFLYSYIAWNIIFSIYANGFILFDFLWNVLFFYVFDLIVREKKREYA